VHLIAFIFAVPEEPPKSGISTKHKILWIGHFFADAHRKKAAGK